jgi:hypothetical protein
MGKTLMLLATSWTHEPPEFKGISCFLPAGDSQVGHIHPVGEYLG